MYVEKSKIAYRLSKWMIDTIYLHFSWFMMTKQKRSELTQDCVICPYCNRVQQYYGHWLDVHMCENLDCTKRFTIEVVQRPDLYITKPL